MNRLTDWKKKLFERIQSGFPLSPAPYAELADEYGVTEGAIIDAIDEFKREGVVRRIGATLDSRKVGYVSTLVACKVEPEMLEDVTAEVGRHPGVTHAYERDGEYNFWFTLITRDEGSLNEVLDRYSNLPGVEELHPLPADKVYKLKVHFSNYD
jgi:DNA-binding Lrp family transcriptional regulator